jgi:hypothetical protein
LLDASDLQKVAKAIELKVSPEARGMAYDMGGFLALAVARYQQLSGDKGVKLPRFTPRSSTLRLWIPSTTDLRTA